MSTVSVRFPHSIHQMAKEISHKDRSSLNQFVVSAVAEKIAALTTADYLEERAKRGKKSKFKAVLKKIPSVAPATEDQL